MSIANNTQSNRPLEVNVDYYIENGYCVFTEKYLRERGHCCGSGCRHCPYRKKSIPQATSNEKKVF